jgi:hypothetical protein
MAAKLRAEAASLEADKAKQVSRKVIDHYP